MLPSDDRDPVDVLAEEFADRLRRGEHPSVSAYAAAHPDHAEQLNELLPAVAQMELLKRFRAPAEKSLPDRLGDFRIVRELGRGGMGVVFEAEQISLGRPVALKILARHAQLDTTRRERFVREAQAAAKLHHTNIVPVFGVGEQDGLPYYAMQLIPGRGLNALVRQWRKRLNKDGDKARHETRDRTPGTKPADTPPPAKLVAPEFPGPDFADWRFVAEAGMQAADALHYAHKQGILHRDVKPANLILDGETVWVTDFGLAKLMNVDGLTGTGDILGTLQYLAPECLAGSADARSDVYGLGATLYELLTLEPPYSADSPAQLVSQVAHTDPRPPRALNPNIPRDLETIVLKAMRREPSARYATARDLARDLEAYLNDRPIAARRTTTVSRAWRWCRRNPAVASLAASTAAALVLAAVTGWVGYARAEDRRQDADGARRAAERAKIEAELAQGRAEEAKANADRAKADAEAMSERLEANLDLSLETFEKVFEAAGGNNPPGFGMPPPLGRGPDRGPNPGSPGGPGAELASDKAAILEAVLTFYDKFAEQNPPTPRLRFQAAKASRRVCEANVGLKRPQKAADANRRAVALLEPLVAEFPDDAAMRTELVQAYLAAPAARSDEPADERDAVLARGLDFVRDTAWLTGSMQFRIGLSREQASDRVAAETAYRAAVIAFTAADAVRPPHGHLELGAVRYRLAWVLSQRGDNSAARKMLEKSISELRPVAGGGSRPDGPARDLLGETYGALSYVCRALNDDRAAVEAGLKGLEYGGLNLAGGGPGGPGGRPFSGWPGGKKDGGPGGKKDNPPPKKN